MVISGTDSKPTVQISEGNVEVGEKDLVVVEDQQRDRRGKTFGSEDGNGLGFVLENLGKKVFRTQSISPFPPLQSGDFLRFTLNIFELIIIHFFNLIHSSLIS